MSATAAVLQLPRRRPATLAPASAASRLHELARRMERLHLDWTRPDRFAAARDALAAELREVALDLATEPRR